MSRWLLINPPTGNYIRDNRCQASVDDIFAVSSRAPADLAYIAGAITENGQECMIRDYPAEKLSLKDMLMDIRTLDVDYLVINTTMFSCEADLSICRACKKAAGKLTIIAKGAVFYTQANKVMERFPDLDIAVTNEEERVFADLSCGKPLEEIDNITFRLQGMIRKNPDRVQTDLELPKPRVDLLRHALYRSPDNNAMQATVVVGRGCPGGCIYCIAPVVGGRIARYRRIDQVIDEIKSYHCHGINNFYFSADTFTWNSKWVYDFCTALRELDFKISWLCTARADRLTEELLAAMKSAGCRGLSMGVESGSENMQRLIGKNLKMQQVQAAVLLCKKYRIITLLHFIIGFPWDDRDSVLQTIRFAKALKGNIVEFYIATPLPGTPLYELVKNDPKLRLAASTERLNQTTVTTGTYHLSEDALYALRKRALRALYFNPFFYLKSLSYIHSLPQLFRCAGFMIRKLYLIVFRKKGKRKG